MRVLVVGGTRFVGRLTVARLLAAGHRVTLLNRGTHADPFGDRVDRSIGDRRSSLRDLLAGERFDATIDFAAFDGADVAGAIDALGDRVGHYVLISSGQVYLVRDGAPRAPIAACESDYAGPLAARPVVPDDAAEWDYGVGKRAAEDVLAAAIARGFPGTAIRIPMVHGELDYHRRLERYLWRLADGGPLLVPGAARPTRHVYGGAVARALVELIGRPATGTAYNLAQRETPTLGELIDALAAAIGATPRVVDPGATDDLADAALAAHGLARAALSPLSTRWMSFVDPIRAERELDFRHPPLAEYLGHIAASFLAHPPAAPPPGYDEATRARERAAIDALG